ncbi:MAG: DUF1573 domain-containing protein [Cytophagaceae bacterium]|nr:DUF1573 domain-containing protein [Cytophagaceae bacterium]MDW8457136.1 DUF1573 domain-containing protein [Cytophagaceae bacterium]
MRIFVCISILSILGLITRAQEINVRNGIITFAETSKDFGTISEGDTISYVYHFTNTGTDTLRIIQVKTTCQCTSKEYTTAPVPPGGKGYVKVVFVSKDKYGLQRKVISVFSNASNSPVNLMLSCIVQKKQP